MKRNILTIDPAKDVETVHAIGSVSRVQILNLLHLEGPLNVNDIAAQMKMPQSTIATNLRILEKAGLIKTSTMKASKGSQKICSKIYDEILFRFDNNPILSNDQVTVSMPIGLFTEIDVTAPCGLCSKTSVIGMLDVQDAFLDPQRMQAALLWFMRGYVEYKFPNNSKISGRMIRKLEFSAELSSETPATNSNWPSDISIWINGIKIGYWTSPGDFGDRRGIYTPSWWKLAGSQYGKLKSWRIDDQGTWLDGFLISTHTLSSLGVADHHSIRFRIGIDEDAQNPGGINIFGKGFGDFDQDIVMTIYF